MNGRHPMSSADAAWLRMDRPTNLMVINAVLWFDEPIDWLAAQEVFRERILDRFPRFSQRVCGGGLRGSAAWQDDPNFDPALHFHRLALPAPGDKGVLQEVVSDLVTRPLERSRPLWDVYLLEDYGSGCAVLVRMHHCIADGIALARVMLSLTDAGGMPNDFATADPPTLRAQALAPLRPLARMARITVHESLESAMHPRQLARVARTANDDARTLAKLLVPGHDPPSVLKGDGHVAHRVAWSAPVRLRAVRDLGHALNATVNDVLVSAVAGAVGTYLDDHGDRPDEIHALVPFNLRSLDKPLPRDLGNRFGLILLGLPVGVRDPVARLRCVKERMDAIKQSHEGPLSYGILEAMGHAPARLEERLVDFFSAKGTMVLTNVPGPRSTVTLAGTPVAGVLVWAPCSGSVGMSISVFSYAGQVSVGFLVDAHLVPDPDELADRFRTELRALARGARRAAATTAHA